MIVHLLVPLASNVLLARSPAQHSLRHSHSARLCFHLIRLIPNCEAKLIDLETGHPIKSYEQEGELCVRGPNIMRGYLNRPDATKETIDADGFLHTGDIAKVDREGYYFIIDRAKELIKFKGFQVPPAELEAKLLDHPAIADVAVVGIPDPYAGEVP